jgi:integrase
MLQEVCGQRLNRSTIEEYLKGWYKDKLVEVSKATYKSYLGNCDRFIAFLGPQAKLPLIALTQKHIESYRNHMVETKRSPKTVNVALKILKAAIGDAHKRGMTFSNPAAFVKTVKSVYNTREVFTNEEIKKLMAVADEEWKGMILLGLYCGMRLRDAANLTKDKIDLEKGVITYMPAKIAGRGKPEVIIPMSSQLAMYVRARFDVEGLALFPRLHGQPAGGNTGLSTQFTDLLTKAGIDRKEKKSAGIKKFFGLSYHSLRHTCVSMMANSGVSEEIRKKLVGHTSDVHRNYTHLELDTLRESISKIPCVA